MNEENKLIIKQDSNYTLNDIFKLFKKSIMQDLHVSTLALYQSTIQEYNEQLGYGIVEVKPLPLKSNQTEYSINCYILSKTEITENQILTVLYTDLNFIDNLQVDKRTPQKIKETSLLHTEMSGVVIGSTFISDTYVNDLYGLFGDPEDNSYIKGDTVISDKIQYICVSQTETKFDKTDTNKWIKLIVED